ncbi:E3 ubiquitin-protein ligase WAVH1-like [Silene latifolia]|uniref:E3 ubiquitin-protein ligase WAVH1-like n=1 Tax=Silene latifolia TaxID=37657 RepID=UPI003D78991D
MVTYNDDEPIQVINENITTGLGVVVDKFKVGVIEVKIERKRDVTNEETKFPVLVEVTGAANGKERMGVDIIAVLDISGSMSQQNKLEKMKRAMIFLIQKLSQNDRLSVVTFASRADRVCKLRQMTADAKVEVGALVNNLRTTTNTNTAEGLKMALQILNDRNLKEGRAMAIMLMSDGVQNEGPKAETIPLDKIPVHTFGFGSGKDYNPAALEAIAKNSISGTFSYAEVNDSETSNLSTVFSQCLAGLLSIVVQDLTVTIQPEDDTVLGVLTKSVIQKIFAGDYKKTTNADGSVTIIFGDLYQQEVRKIVVEFLLPAVVVKTSADTKIIGVKRSFKVGGSLKNPRPTVGTVTRTKTPSSEESDKLKAEILRIETLETIESAIEKAEKRDFVNATKLLTDAQGALDDAEFEEPNASIDALKQEVDLMLEYMQDGDIYEKKGRPFAMCSRTSHGRQRFAGRGDDVKNVRSFATPRMDTFLEQAEAFENNPDPNTVTSVEEDEKVEASADPLGNLAPSLIQYLEDAIEALNNIRLLITQSRG